MVKKPILNCPENEDCTVPNTGGVKTVPKPYQEQRELVADKRPKSKFEYRLDLRRAVVISYATGKIVRLLDKSLQQENEIESTGIKTTMMID